MLKRKLTEAGVDAEGRITAPDFVKFVESLQLGWNTGQISEIFGTIDISQNNFVKYDDLVAAFRSPPVSYPYDLETAILKVAEQVGPS